MYSGNHGTHPLHTIINAAVCLSMIRAFPCVRRGVRKNQADAVVGPTIRSLPYQSLAPVHKSLLLADLHVVTMEDKVVGITPPGAKINDALAVGRPIMFVGPEK